MVMNAEIERLGGNMDQGIAEVSVRIDNIEAEPPRTAISQLNVAPVEEIYIEDDLEFGGITVKEFVKRALKVISTKNGKGMKGTFKTKRKEPKTSDEDHSLSFFFVEKS